MFLWHVAKPRLFTISSDCINTQFTPISSPPFSIVGHIGDRVEFSESETPHNYGTLDSHQANFTDNLILCVSRPSQSVPVGARPLGIN